MKFMQNLGKSLMMPIAVMPVAAILYGIGNWITNTLGTNIVSVFLTSAGSAVIDNLAVLFAIGIAFGMAKKSDGVAALAGLVSWLVVTVLLAPESIAGYLGGIEVADVDPAFENIQNAFVGIICGLIGAFSYNRFHGVKLPDWLAFFSGKRAVAIVAAGASIVMSVLLFFIWPFVYGALVAFGEWIVGFGPIGAGIYGFLNRLLIPTGLHHALNSVFWFDVAGINDVPNFLAGADGPGTLGITGMYTSGFFPIMMFGLPGAALAMYVTARSSRKKVAAGILFSAAFASFFVGITEPLEFSFMFLAPVLYVFHALFTGISMAITALLPARMGFGFSAGAIDLGLGWNNPLAQNPWMLLLLGIAWFVVYFLVFTFVIRKWQLKTIGREDDDELADEAGDGQSVDAKYAATANRFLAALGGADNITSLDNCATRLRMEVGDVSKVDDSALKRAGAAGTMKPGGTSVQVIYGLNVQFVKDAMEGIMSGAIEPPAADAPAAVPATDTIRTVTRTDRRVVQLRQPIAGDVKPLSEVPDPTFAEQIMGPGLAIEPTGDTVVSPAPGRVGHAFDTGHAIAIVTDDDLEVLVHIGLDTVDMKGDGFTTLVKTGDIVDEGTPLIRVDLEKIRAAGHPTITPVIVLNDENATIEFR
ncbi:MAG TPA: N-acetylglucosamine-specific PTS transporter subunit IIBC [Candidatus Microbacterium stercoravium]|uniref:N-acetylglucosamine-specific PTS transporter subunit IIBC n=1 Tax=Candidatus Microbacterium stercoravium TaxID=2838697 RepID=A0A9D2H5V4_9MICO|nr:N-acetylglucosamine-specific PTS transporter subunit IIBC [Candidatus Microbacterium stercoravium]